MNTHYLPLYNVNCLLFIMMQCSSRQVIAWFVVIFGVNTMSDISKLLNVISRAVRRVKCEPILKYHEWYLCQITHTNDAIICLYYMYYWNTTALSQSNCRNFSCSSIKEWMEYNKRNIFYLALAEKECFRLPFELSFEWFLLAARLPAGVRENELNLKHKSPPTGIQA